MLNKYLSLVLVSTLTESLSLISLSLSSFSM